MRQEVKTAVVRSGPNTNQGAATRTNDNKIVERVKAIIKRKEQDYAERIGKKYAQSPEKLNRIMSRLKNALRNTELCLISYKVNRQNLSDPRITDDTIEAIVDHVFELFFAINLRVNFKAYNRVYVLTGLSADRDPNVFEIYPHWTLLYGIYHPYIKRVYFDEVRDETNGNLLYVKCTIIDKEGNEYTHTAAGTDIDKYHKWPDKCTMLKKHALRQALAFTFPLVLARFGIETYVVENPDEINEQYISTPKSVSSYSSQAEYRSNDRSKNKELKNQVKKLYDILVRLMGPEKAAQAIEEYKNDNNITTQASEWSEEQLMGLIAYMESIIQEHQQEQNYGEPDHES